MLKNGIAAYMHCYNICHNGYAILSCLFKQFYNKMYILKVIFHVTFLCHWLWMHCILIQEVKKRLSIQNSVEPVHCITGTEPGVPTEFLDFFFWHLWPMHCCGGDLTLFLTDFLYLDGLGGCEYVLCFGQSFQCVCALIHLEILPAWLGWEI